MQLLLVWLLASAVACSGTRIRHVSDGLPHMHYLQATRPLLSSAWKVRRILKAMWR